ncbi:MAG: hypothetical protein Q4C54_02535 [Clostridia bacterium]|nr:hypothetical protein [Clostridia bacterium]
MERYLTAKGQKKHYLDIVWVAVFGVLTIAGLSVTGDYFADRETDMYATSIFMDALFMWPLVAIFRRRFHLSRARKIIEEVELDGRRNIPADDIQRKVGSFDVGKELRWLVRKGYVRRIHATPYGDVVVEDVPNTRVVIQKEIEYVPAPEPAPAPARFINIKCPCCGAPIRVQEGSDERCSYCGNRVNG